MKRLKDFTEKSYLDEKLTRAVVRQVGCWEYFQEVAEDVTNHGAMGGFSGFTYYVDTEAFTKHNKALILDMAKEQAQDIDADNIFSMIANFNCIDLSAEEVAEAIYNHQSEDRTTVYNALAWYALEEVCRVYSDLIYEERNA